MTFHGETILEMMGAQLLPEETGQAMRPCAILPTGAALYVAENVQGSKEVRVLETVPMGSLLSLERMEPPPGASRFMHVKA